MISFQVFFVQKENINLVQEYNKW